VVPRETAPLVRALAAALREVAERRAVGSAELRRTITVMNGGEEGKAA
jgi:hypothetical protein